MSQEKIKITIGVLTATSYLHLKFVESLMQLQYPNNAEVGFDTMQGYQIPFARNQVVQDALKNNSDYVFFIDSDMVFPPDVLLKLLQHKKDIVNALAFRRQLPHFPAIFKWVKSKHHYETIHYVPNTGLIKVDATGMACILINTEVFKKLKKPYYYYDENLFSSDLTFCRQCKKAKISVFVDTNTKIGHIGDNIVATEDDYLKNRKLETIEKYKHSSLKELYEREKN